MDDPTRPWLLEIEDPIAFVRDVRNWRAEQREKYGPDWKDTDPPGLSDYERSRGYIPADTPIPSEERRKKQQQK
jgi:hypothetical protein